MSGCSHDISRGSQSHEIRQSMSLLTELDAFFTEHQRCGELDAGVEGTVVWIACDCAASMARRVDDGDDAGRLHDHRSA
jgi:hypothetical protein